MRVLFVDAPPELLEERRRLGLDVRDELWEGVVHVVPQPGFDHQYFNGGVVAALRRRAEQRGLLLTHEVAVFHPGRESTDYRVPDVVVARPEYRHRRGIAGPPELVLETLSPGDETRQKLAFYADLGCREVLIVDRVGRAIELLRLVGGALRMVAPGETGAVRLEALDIDLRVAGDRLHLSWIGGEADIPFGG